MSITSYIISDRGLVTEEVGREHVIDHFYVPLISDLLEEPHSDRVVL
jgi:hypothetical protein